MLEPRWIPRLAVDAMHFELLERDGGLRGVLDENALESALGRPVNKRTYDPSVDVFDLGAAYGFGLATNHAYNDGNKRIAFAVMYTFLAMHGWEIDVPEPAVVTLMLDVAAGTMDEPALGQWLRTHTVAF